MKRRSLSEKLSAVEALHDYGIMVDARELFLNGEVDANGEIGNMFVKNIRYLQQISEIKPIVIHLHSVGGDWLTGMMIHDAIVACPCPIIIVCHGCIASMGTVIVTACFKHPAAIAVAMPNCDFLYHWGTTDISPELTQNARRSWGKWEDNLNKAMLDWYFDCARKADKFDDYTDNKLRNYLKDKLDVQHDWWLSSEQALEHGFLDGIFGSKGYESIEAIKTGKFEDYVEE